MTVPIRLVARHYEFITPLITGDVQPEGIDLEIDRQTPISQFRDDETFDAGEFSFSQYLRLLSGGDSDIIGFPVFIMRGFRQRCFFVRRESGLASFADLAGKRVGTNGWPDSGNTWSRALLRDAGVNLNDIEWTVATIDGVVDQIYGHKVSAPNLPTNASLAPEGTTLVDLLLNNGLDALMIPWPPMVFSEPDSPVVRLYPNYREVEEAYAARTGIYPCHHILGVRARVVEQHPWVAQSLFDAFEAARLQSERRCQLMLDTAPWLQEELERLHQILGPDWQAHGVEPNRAMIATFADELYQQGVLADSIDPSRIFARFEELTQRA
jgi:4,5-dihydroxyphthalate decarboxylase